VYRAYDEVLHRDVAVKVVNKDARLDDTGSQHLLHEARASSSLSHPNICTIHEVSETDGDLYIVMELVEGKSLRATASRLRAHSLAHMTPASFIATSRLPISSSLPMAW
jgi:serine/threonine protein kinase